MTLFIESLFFNSYFSFSKQKYVLSIKLVLCIFPIFLIGCNASNPDLLADNKAFSIRSLSHIYDDARGRKRVVKPSHKEVEVVVVHPTFEEPAISDQAIGLVVDAPEEFKSKKEPIIGEVFVDNTDPKFKEIIPAANKHVLTGVYAKIASAALSAKKFSGEALLRGSEHNLEAHKQNLLPQITPRASVDANGDTIAQLQIEQVLFDNGRYAAGKDVLLSEKATVSANLRAKKNERISRAIAAYIKYHHARTSQSLLKETITSFHRLEKQSESRIYNGIGKGSDRDLFQLKKLEVEADYETQESISLSSAQEFTSLTGIKMPIQSPLRMKLPDVLTTSPMVELAQAERATAFGNLALDKSNQRPKVSLNGNIGMATNTFDEENMDLRVDVSLSQPLTWGFNHGLAASESEVEASNRKYDEAVKDTGDRLKVLRFDLKQGEISSKRLKELASTAKKRLNKFNSQFLAGQAGIIEASSIVEAYKKIKMNAIDTEFGIYNTELELAAVSGLLSE